MKKIGQICRKITTDYIKDSLKNAQGFFVVRNIGLSSNDFNLLRDNLKQSKARLFLTKNAITKRLLKEDKRQNLAEFIQGPTAFVFIQDDPVAAAKAVYNFSQEHKNLELVAGFCEDRLLEKNELITLAKLPTKDILRAQVVMTIASPLQGLVGVLNNTIAKLVWTLDAIANKKK